MKKQKRGESKSKYGWVEWRASILDKVVRESLIWKDNLHWDLNIILNILSLQISHKHFFWSGHLLWLWYVFTSSVTEYLLNYLYHWMLLNRVVLNKLNRITTRATTIYMTLCQGYYQWEIIMNSSMLPHYLEKICKLTLLILRE